MHVQLDECFMSGSARPGPAAHSTTPLAELTMKLAHYEDTVTGPQDVQVSSGKFGEIKAQESRQ